MTWLTKFFERRQKKRGSMERARADFLDRLRGPTTSINQATSTGVTIESIREAANAIGQLGSAVSQASVETEELSPEIANIRFDSMMQFDGGNTEWPVRARNMPTFASMMNNVGNIPYTSGITRAGFDPVNTDPTPQLPINPVIVQEAPSVNHETNAAHKRGRAPRNIE